MELQPLVHEEGSLFFWEKTDICHILVLPVRNICNARTLPHNFTVKSDPQMENFFLKRIVSVYEDDSFSDFFIDKIRVSGFGSKNQTHDWTVEQHFQVRKRQRR